MGYDLISWADRKRCFCFGGQEWGRMLQLAVEYGWEPEGTRRPACPEDCEPLGEWDGGYCSNDYQGVTATDAAALAAALERTLPDIPGNRTLPEDMVTIYAPAGGTAEEAAALVGAIEEQSNDKPVRVAFPHNRCVVAYPSGALENVREFLAREIASWNEPTNFCEFFAGERKTELKNFIAFCRAGGFTIG